MKQFTGGVELASAHIGGRLTCGGGKFSNPNGVALNAYGLTVDGSLLCREGFSASGEVHLLGAHIGGGLYCAGVSSPTPTVLPSVPTGSPSTEPCSAAKGSRPVAKCAWWAPTSVASSPARGVSSPIPTVLPSVPTGSPSTEHFLPQGVLGQRRGTPTGRPHRRRALLHGGSVLQSQRCCSRSWGSHSERLSAHGVSRATGHP
jgi:hypothetical protein